MKFLFNHKFKGAVMVEAAICMALYLAFLGFIFTFAVATFRYVMLIDTASSVLRQISVDASSGYGTCSNLNTTVATKVRDYMLNMYGVAIDDPNIVISASTIQTSPGYTGTDCRAAMTLQLSWGISCYFCTMLSIPTAVHTTQTRDIEDSHFRRCAGCSSCPT